MTAIVQAGGAVLTEMRQPAAQACARMWSRCTRARGWQVQGDPAGACLNTADQLIDEPFVNGLGRHRPSRHLGALARSCCHWPSAHLP